MEEKKKLKRKTLILVAISSLLWIFTCYVSLVSLGDEQNKFKGVKSWRALQTLECNIDFTPESTNHRTAGRYRSAGHL